MQGHHKKYPRVIRNLFLLPFLTTVTHILALNRVILFFPVFFNALVYNEVISGHFSSFFFYIEKKLIQELLKKLIIIK